MIAKLFNAPNEDDANTIGTSTIGSSEAIMVRQNGHNFVGDKLTVHSLVFLP